MLKVGQFVKIPHNVALNPNWKGLGWIEDAMARFIGKDIQVTKINPDKSYFTAEGFCWPMSILAGVGVVPLNDLYLCRACGHTSHIQECITCNSNKPEESTPVWSRPNRKARRSAKVDSKNSAVKQQSYQQVENLPARNYYYKPVSIKQLSNLINKYTNPKTI